VGSQWARRSVCNSSNKVENAVSEKVSQLSGRKRTGTFRRGSRERSFIQSGGAGTESTIGVNKKREMSLDEV